MAGRSGRLLGTDSISGMEGMWRLIGFIQTFTAAMLLGQGWYNMRRSIRF